MRINVYSQEIDLDTPPQIIGKEGRNSEGMPETFYGIRFYLKSAPELHHSERDDDRSAITFWLPKSEAHRRFTAEQFNEAYHLIVEVIMKVPE